MSPSTSVSLPTQLCRRVGDRGVFGRRQGVGIGHRRVVDRRHVDGDRRRVAGRRAVAHRVGEAGRAVEVGRRGEGDGAVGVENRGAAGAAAHRGDRQRVAVDVGVVADQLRRRVGDRGVFGRRQGVGIGHRRVVDRRHVDRDRRRVAGRRAVAHRVGEAVRAVEVGGRREGDGAVGVENRGAAGAAAHRGDRQRVAVDVGVVADQLCRRVGDRGVFGRRQVSAFATGASLTAVTLTVTVAGLLVAVPSLTV